MPGIKKIGVITSGGDCGGLNAVIKGVAREAFALGIESVVIPHGYAGLYNLVQLDKVVYLNAARVSKIDASLAGSEAGHSRVKISKIADPDKYERIKEGLKKFGIDALVISGGDDTGSVVVDLTSKGIACVHVPKTMDLDLQSYSVGGDSAINRIAVFTRDLKTTGMSHNRILVIEVFGRYVGHTALRGGVGGEADCILIPEIPVDFDEVYEHMKTTYFARIERSDVKAGTYIMVVAEGIKTASGELLYDESAGVDAFGHRKLAGAGKYVRQQLEKRMKVDPEVKDFMQRTGMFAPGVYEVPEVSFTDDALVAVAKEALKRKSGARGLRAILERAMLDLMYELPSLKDVQECLINADFIIKQGEPILTFRTTEDEAWDKAGVAVQ